MKFFVRAIPRMGKTTFCCGCVVWVVFVGTGCGARAMQTDGTPNRGSHAGKTNGAGDTAAANKQQTNSVVLKPQSLPSTSDVNGKPATVILKNGLLTVEANNSDLGQILKDIASISGMSIDGSVNSVRVFGVYGPSNSRAVLTDLLTGLGYNFMMVGATHEGTPRQLQLTPRNAGAASSPSPAPNAAASAPRENPSATPLDPDAPGPGAILTVPPAPPEDPQERMKQNLQRLQQMHEPPKPPQ